MRYPPTVLKDSFINIEISTCTNVQFIVLQRVNFLIFPDLRNRRKAKHMCKQMLTDADDQLHFYTFKILARPFITLNHHIPAQLEAGENLQILALHRRHEVEISGGDLYQPRHCAGKDRAY